MTLSHGQAAVERGFNVNKMVNKFNSTEKSIKSRKMIIDHMQKKKQKPSTIEITPKLVKSVRSARQRYKSYLEEQKKNTKQNERNQQLDILNTEIKDTTKRKQLLLDACHALDKDFVKLIKEGAAENDMDVVQKGISLKRKSEDKRSEIDSLDIALNVLQEKKKKLM